MADTETHFTVEESFTQAEQRFDQWRRWAGIVLAPVVFIGLLFWPFPSLSTGEHRLAAIAATTVVLWVTEPIPLPVTALLAATACALLQVGPIKDIFAPFADPLIFLFIGSFMIARAVFVHQLDQRLVEEVMRLPWVNGHPVRVLWAFGGLTFLLSMWLSNTATTAMMLPLGLSILARLPTANGRLSSRDQKYATALMLITAYSASLGGIVTPVGTPPNIIALGYLRQLTPYYIPFFNWMILAGPIACAMFFVMGFWFWKRCRPSTERLSMPEGRERQKLNRGQRSVLVAFSITVALWILPGLLAIFLGVAHPWSMNVRGLLPESAVALIGAILLFVLPGEPGRRVLTWPEAARIDWGTILLFGGGLSLGTLLFQTGLAERVGGILKGVMNQPLPASPELILILAAAIVSTLSTELVSNVAATNMLIPLVIATAQSMGVDPLMPTLAATIAASMAFTLPVATPPNAIVYGSGYIPVTKMIRYGLFLDLVGVIAIATGIYFLRSLVQ